VSTDDDAGPIVATILVRRTCELTQGSLAALAHFVRVPSELGDGARDGEEPPQGVAKGRV
jgi:hypothetical protein